MNELWTRITTWLEWLREARPTAPSFSTSKMTTPSWTAKTSSELQMELRIP
jgi:hypothetical protein